MNLKIERTFAKDLKKIKDPVIRRAIADAIMEIQEARRLSEVSNLKKLKSGARMYYRKKIKDFRIGAELEDQTVILVRVLPRKDIYKYFPK